MLLDTASLYYRAYFGVPDSVKAPDGTPVNAVRGLLDFIGRLVQDHRPDDLVACMDADWRPHWRVELIPSYKAHRVAQESETGPDLEETPDTLAPQVPIIEAALDAFGIARVGVAGYEADDVIGTLTARATGPVDIVTGDRDLYQLVDDARRRRVLYPLKGVGSLQVTDEAWLREKYGVDGPGYADLALLRGDPSDGLPGVPGIGEKTAAKLLGGQAPRRLRQPGRDHRGDRRPEVEADPHSAQAAGRVAPVSGGGPEGGPGGLGRRVAAVRSGPSEGPCAAGTRGGTGPSVGFGWSGLPSERRPALLKC